MIESQSKLYLIPNLIGDVSPEQVVPAVLPSLVESLKYFIVEDMTK